MSELMLNQIQHMLNNVNTSVQEMGDQSEERMDTLLGALDDVAANVMATQAVLQVLLKKVPVTVEEVSAALAADIGGPVPDKTLAVATFLVTGNKG